MTGVMAAHGIRAGARRGDRAAALAPVQEAMLRRAHEQAGLIVARARAQAADTVARARRAAGEAMAQARQAGLAQAAPLLAAERNRGQREARAVLLQLQRATYDEFRARVRAAVRGMADEPGYGLLRQRLAETATALAGPGATVTDAAGGGVIARGPGVVVDCSLTRLADAAVEALSSQVPWLWTPEGGDRQ